MSEHPRKLVTVRKIITKEDLGIVACTAQFQFENKNELIACFESAGMKVKKCDTSSTVAELYFLMLWPYSISPKPVDSC